MSEAAKTEQQPKGSKLAADLRRFAAIPGAWRLLLAMILYGVGTGILAPMNAIYLRDSIGLSKNEIAVVFAVSLLLNMIVTITVGYYSDRLHSKKRLPLVAAVLCMSGLIVYMNAESFVVALVGMTLATAPSGLIMGQLFAMARNHFTKMAGEIVEMAQLWLRASFSVGFFTGLLLGANIFLWAEFRGVLWGNLAGYVMLFLLLLTYKEIKSPPGVKPIQTSKGEPFSLIMLIALLLISCSDAIRGLYLPLVVRELFGRPELMSYLWSGQAVFELGFMTLAGYWAAKYGSKRIIWLGALCAFITFAVYSMAPPLWVFFLMQPFYSFFVSVLYGIAMGYVQRMFLSRTGFGASLYVFISQTASLIGYFLPFAVKGITPSIFFIPSALVFSALILMVWIMRRDRAIGRLADTAAG